MEMDSKLLHFWNIDIKSGIYKFLLYSRFKTDKEMGN